MPQIDTVSVRNVNTNQVWVTNQQATAPNTPLPLNYNVYVNAGVNNQPPVGFFNNPAHQFVITGRYIASGAAFISGLITINPALTNPPLVFVFSI